MHVVVGNLDEYASGEEDHFHQKVLVVHDRDLVVTDVDTDIVLMFKATEVLLDNQGGRSVQSSSQKSCFTTSAPSADPTVFRVSTERVRMD